MDRTQMAENVNESRERRRPPVHPSLSEPMPLKEPSSMHHDEHLYFRSDGHTPLHEAIVRRLWKKATRMVVKLRADVNIGDQRGGTSPLHYAIIRGAPLSFIKMMIIEGRAEVGPRIMDDYGGGALPCASQNCMRIACTCEPSCGTSNTPESSTNNEEKPTPTPDNKSDASTSHAMSSCANTSTSIRGVNPTSSSSVGPILRTALYYDSLKVSTDPFMFQTVERIVRWEKLQRTSQKKRLLTTDTGSKRSIGDDEPLTTNTCTSMKTPTPTTILTPYERLITYDPIIVHSFRCWANHPLVTLPYSNKYNRSRCSDCGALADMCNTPMAAICRPCGYVRCLECVLEQCNLVVAIRSKNEGNSGAGKESEMQKKVEDAKRSSDEVDNEDVSSSEDVVIATLSSDDDEGNGAQSIEKKQSPSSSLSFRVCALESTRFDSRLSTDKKFFSSIRCEKFECVCCSGRDFKRGTVYRIVEGKEESQTSDDGFSSEDEKIKRLQANLGQGTAVPDCNRYICGVCAIRLNFPTDTTETLVKKAQSAASFSERALAAGLQTPLLRRGVCSGTTIFHPLLPHHSEKSMPGLHCFWTSAPYSSAPYFVNAPTPLPPRHISNNYGGVHVENENGASSTPEKSKSKAMLLDEGKSPQLLAMLIGELGLDPLRARDKEGNTVLHVAAGMGMVNCVRAIINSYHAYFLMNRVQGNTNTDKNPLLSPSSSQSPQVCSTPSAGPFPTLISPLLCAVNMSLITPLHVAAYSTADNISNVIRVLVEEFGADPDGSDGPCFAPTPLFLSVLNIGRQNTLVNAETLLDLGASPADVKAYGAEFWARKAERRKKASAHYCHFTMEKKTLAESILEKVSFDCCQILTSAFSSYERAVVNSRWCARDVMWESSGRPRSFVMKSKAMQYRDLYVEEDRQVAADGNIADVFLCLSTQRPTREKALEPTHKEVRRYVGYLKPAQGSVIRGRFASSLLLTVPQETNDSDGKDEPLPKPTTDIIDDTNYLFDAYMAALEKALSPSGNGYALLGLVVWSTDKFAIKKRGALLARRFLEHGADVRACVDIGRLFPIGVLLDPTSVALFRQEGLV